MTSTNKENKQCKKSKKKTEMNFLINLLKRKYLINLLCFFGNGVLYFFEWEEFSGNEEKY